jgi:hypothetical protein
MKAKHFKIHELVDEKTYLRYGEKAWWFIDESLICLIDAMRDEFGPATINNYRFGGDRSWSGLRTTESEWYSPYSQHTFGRAADILFKEHTAADVRKAMTENPDKWLAICPSITLEDDVSWVHVDVRNGENCIRLFKP